MASKNLKENIFYLGVIGMGIGAMLNVSGPETADIGTQIGSYSTLIALVGLILLITIKRDTIF